MVTNMQDIEFLGLAISNRCRASKIVFARIDYLLIDTFGRLGFVVLRTI